MINPVAFNVFGKDIYWYGIIMASAMLVGIVIAYRLMKRTGLNPDLIYDLALVVVPLAVIGARAYYVVFEWGNYFSRMPFWEVFAVWHGGLAIYGGVIGGLFGLLLFCRWKKVPFAKIVDVVAPALILGQAIGRWGNFVNQEAYGNAVANPSWQFFPATVFIQATGRYHLATFFYESAWNLLVFAFLMLYVYGIILKKKKRVDGEMFVMYLVLYGLGRFFIEGLRTDSLMLGGLRVSQWLSALLVVAGIVYFALQKRIDAWMEKRKTTAAQGPEEPEKSGEAETGAEEENAHAPQGVEEKPDEEKDVEEKPDEEKDVEEKPDEEKDGEEA